MNISENITQLKQVFEEEHFRGAGKKELKGRQDDYTKNQRKTMFDKADELVPGSVQALQEHFQNDDLVETALAYSDSGVEELLGDLTPADAEPIPAATALYGVRDLSWDGFWTDAETFKEQCEIVGGYNNFGPDIGDMLARDFSEKEFRLARESSPAVYIRPMRLTDLPYQYDAAFDEMSNENDGSIRMWWD